MRRLAVAALLTACGRADDGEPRALLVVLDGVRTDELTGLAPSPLTGLPGDGWAPRTWETFGAEGTVVREALNPGITITAPAHAALLTGRNEPVANFPVGDEGVGWYRPERPTLFEEVRAQLALGEEDVVLLGNTELIEPVSASVQPGAAGARWRIVPDPSGAPAAEDAPVLDAIEAAVEEGPPKLMVVNFHDVDREGHYGDPPDYAEGVRVLDGLVGDLHDWLRGGGAAYADGLLVLVTADHGRHRTYDDEGWRNHGDACVGCRAVPLLVWGGGAAEGEVLDAGPYTTLDVAPTLAAHLGVDVPWAQGIPLSPLVEGLGGNVRSGDVDPAALGDTLAVRRFRDDLEARSEVVVDGEVVSTPGAFAAEEPALAALADGSRVVCFREIELEPDADELPWRPRCLRDAGDGWVDIGFAAPEAGPLWKPVLLGVGGGLVAVWNHNPNGIGELGAVGDVGVQTAAWDPETGWAPGPAVASYFPTDVSAAATPEGLAVAFGASEGGTDARLRRWVYVAREVDGALEPGEPFDLAEVLGADARVERPALARVGDTLRLAMHGYGDGGRVVAACESADGGATWTTPIALPTAGDPLPHLTPGWDGDDLVWAEAGEEETALCRARPGDATATCMGAGSARVDGMVVVPGAVVVSRDAGVGAWETSTLTW